MKKSLWITLASFCAIATAAISAAPARAQMAEVKEKPPMYTYVAFWDIPRAQWGDMEKSNAADRSLLDKAIANGSIVGYGDDINLVHQADGPTHDDWWSATSMAGVLNMLDQFFQSGNVMTPVLGSAMKHWDAIYVSRYYNWHSGSWKGAYTHGSYYKLRPDAPDDAVTTLSKNLIVPLLEKMLADDTIHEYEVDTEAIHTEDPGGFWVFYVAANADGLDKFNDALRERRKSNPLSGSAFESMVDDTVHRDYLARTSLTYK